MNDPNEQQPTEACLAELDDCCLCKHDLTFPPLPSDAVFGAIIRRELATRADFERVLGRPSCRRCSLCPGADVEYWFAKDGDRPPVALLLNYLPNDHLLDFALVTDAFLRETVKRRCVCFQAPAILWSRGLEAPLSGQLPAEARPPAAGEDGNDLAVSGVGRAGTARTGRPR